MSEIKSEPPIEFDGPGDLWSPETLMMAAAADCFTLTFRAAAKITNLNWLRLECTAQGTVDRVNSVTQFTEVRLKVRLTVPPGVETEKAKRLLEKTEKGCLIANSLNCKRSLECLIETDSRELKTA